MRNPRVQGSQTSIPSKPPEPSRKDSVTTFSETEIRTRAYQVYESRGKAGNQPDDDWRQAEVELMELLHAK